MNDSIPVSDNELIHLVKEKNDSTALTELIHRHSGIYVSTLHKFSGYSDKIQIEELKEDKQYNIYKWIISYKEDKNMKLGTYIGEMTKYKCLNLINQSPNNITMEEVKEPANTDNVSNQVSNDDTLESLKQRAKAVDNDKFWPIFEARHFSQKPKTWRQIGLELGITHEWARQIYMRHLPKIQSRAKS